MNLPLRLFRTTLRNSHDFLAILFKIVVEVRGEKIYLIDMERFQKKQIIKDLEKKVVLLSGPRQSGKTWLALDIKKEFPNSVYLNYDHAEDREIIKNESWLPDTDLVILDELHKMQEWNNYLKGLYDTKNSRLKILVTGSARLDVFMKSGDALPGRFFKHRLLPLSYKECLSAGLPENGLLKKLIKRGGFPEPFLSENTEDASRWRMQYLEGVLKTDVFDFHKYLDLKSLGVVTEILRQRVGAPASYSSIARDAQISPNTVKKYMTLLENLYIIFRIYPHAREIARAMKKEPKVYFFDNGMVKNGDGAAFENMIAVSLLKNVFYKRDVKGIDSELRYIRTKDKEEVDFCELVDGRPVRLIETKITGPNPGKTIYRFKEKLGIEGCGVFLDIKREKLMNGLQLLEAGHFLRSLEI
ncbi:MAG: ATP-binding protein [Fibrobacterota bacterium]